MVLVPKIGFGTQPFYTFFIFVMVLERCLWFHKSINIDVDFLLFVPLNHITTTKLKPEQDQNENQLHY